MDNFSSKFTKFMVCVLKPLLIVVVLVSFGTVFAIPLQEGSSFIGLIPVMAIYIVAVYSGYKIIVAKNYKNKAALILAIAFILRVLWLVNMNSIPTSDFKTMYDAAGDLLNGNYSMFKDSGYIARFPHLTIMVLYMALVRDMFPINNVLAMKSVNLFMGTVTVFLLYLIAKEIFKSKKHALYTELGAAILPALVTYTGVLCSENIAMPFYLMSIYLFLLALKSKNKAILILLSGLVLVIGNLFRGVAIVVLIAYIIYLFIYFKDSIFAKIKYIVILLTIFVLIMTSVSNILREKNIIQNTLTKGSEPAITNVLKGTNISSGGRWNEEDAMLPEKFEFDYDKIEDKSKEIIVDRFTNTNPIILFAFYIRKFSMQWNEGECAGAFWSQLDVPENQIVINIAGGGKVILQLVYVAFVLLVFFGIKDASKIKQYTQINLIYIILCGYGALYLITESQSRYSYIVCWIFVILAIPGFEYILEKYKLSEKIIGSN